MYITKVISLIYFNISRLHHPFLLPLFLTLLFYSKNPLKALISITLRGCILLKLDISNYILCLSNLYIPLFGIIILKNLHILYHFTTFCNHIHYIKAIPTNLIPLSYSFLLHFVYHFLPYYNLFDLSEIAIPSHSPDLFRSEFPLPFS